MGDLLKTVELNMLALMPACPPNGYTTDKFAQKYKEVFESEIPYAKLGYPSLENFIMAVDNVFDFDFTSQGMVIVPLVKQKPTAPPQTKTVTTRQQQNAQYDAIPGLGDYEEEDQGAKKQEELRARVIQLLSWSGKGIKLSEFGDKFKRTFGLSNPREYGFTLWVDVFNDLKDVVDMHKSEGEYVVIARPITKLRATAPVVESEPVEPKKRSATTAFVINESVVFKKIVSKFKLGLELSRLPEEYEQETLQKLKYREKGFSSILDMVKSFPSIFRIVEDSKSKEILLYENYSKSDEGCSRWRQNSFTAIPASDIKPNIKQDPDSKSYSEHLKCDLPDDAVTKPVELPIQTLPIDTDVGSYAQVNIGHVETPSKFWLQLRGKETSMALEGLLKEMELVYCGSRGSKYYLPVSDVVEELICAAIYPPQQYWMRAIVMKIHSPKKITVYYVDYGDTCDVSYTSLRYLKSSLTSLPAQAIRAQLAYVMPINGSEWNSRTVTTFTNMVKHRPLMALVAGYTVESLIVCLCDTSGKTDIHINDVLVDKKLAEKATSLCAMTNEPQHGVEERC